MKDRHARQEETNGMSGWARDVRRFHAFVDGLPTSAFLSLVETLLVSVGLGLYLALYHATQWFRIMLLLFALVLLAFGLSVVAARRSTREGQMRTNHTPLSVALIAVAFLLNLSTAWIVWAIETSQ